MKLLMEDAITFIGTNVDELFILMTLYLGSEKTFKKYEIMLGQCLGLSILIC